MKSTTETNRKVSPTVGLWDSQWEHNMSKTNPHAYTQHFQQCDAACWLLSWKQRRHSPRHQRQVTCLQPPAEQDTWETHTGVSNTQCQWKRHKQNKEDLIPECDDCVFIQTKDRTLHLQLSTTKHTQTEILIKVFLYYTTTTHSVSVRVNTINYITLYFHTWSINDNDNRENKLALYVVLSLIRCQVLLKFMCYGKMHRAHVTFTCRSCYRTWPGSPVVCPERCGVCTSGWSPYSPLTRPVNTAEVRQMSELMLINTLVSVCLLSPCWSGVPWWCPPGCSSSRSAAAKKNHHLYLIHCDYR